MSDIIAFEGVSYSYRGDWLQRIQALKSVDFSVPEGSAYGFLGANGAGKSTSIKLLTGLLHGHQGRIHLFGKPLGAAELRRSLGYLPEQPFFYENLQVREYLAYLGKLSGLRGAELDAARERVYQRLDLGDLRKRKLGSFSKGMRQRFGLAQAILHAPELIVLDEPFSGLDPLWRARFKQILREERERGATLFFSSHILADVEDLCDRYCLIDHGKILEAGAIAELFAQAPLQLVGQGPAPDGAQAHEDGTWSLTVEEDRRAEALTAVSAAGGELLRLERHRMALEDYFVQRVAQSHAAGSTEGAAHG
ncbi:MAG: ABC transporter ATP-binding protein [Planctomycetota bacterium]